MTKKGFTLVELLVVVAIIGILAAILVPNVRQNLERAKVAKTKALISSLEYALVAYKNDFGKYPASYDLQGLFIALTEQAKTSYEPDADEVLKFPDSRGGSDNERYWFDPISSDSELEGTLQSAGVPDIGITAQQEEEFVFVDAWDRPIYYISSDEYNPGGRKDFRRGNSSRRSLDKPCAYELKDGDRFRPFKPTSFQLISFGPDGLTVFDNNSGGLGSMIDSDKEDNDDDNFIDKSDVPRTDDNNLATRAGEDDITNFQ
ncbi:MAG: prepilin-type N-terminal cleavage/methylation domain-containing protein [Candidatus Hinthialibacter antarcticus]|nr:prepilin-type N-terminal cleavage/methylation domain-containing protein [Candidatus Hinthialibacter antarcticus]